MNVIIPTSLRQHADGSGCVLVSGETVKEALDELVSKCPALQKHLFDDSGSLVSHLNIFVNDENIRDLNHGATVLDDRDELILVPAIAGG